ncbi:hypothetical protein Y032_0006g2915 [Ancylostoma ceylanicum]|uniref:Uncharacterized protein n=1 Tax=Ancylostoma ceylanicum TaxID=53326 RepID=A0A016VP01_9BILA|nr:hypothetical protein Y032_0006g2915 [Ancylostoma ceylanicum]
MVSNRYIKTDRKTDFEATYMHIGYHDLIFIYLFIYSCTRGAPKTKYNTWKFLKPAASRVNRIQCDREKA